MKCIVTAGPTYEPVDEVRRLTNFSTGRLGTRLANRLRADGHSTTLLLGHYATFREADAGVTVIPFTTTQSLLELLEAAARDAEEPVGAVFHAAAVSDFLRCRALPAGLRGPDGAGLRPQDPDP